MHHKILLSELNTYGIRSITVLVLCRIYVSINVDMHIRLFFNEMGLKYIDIDLFMLIYVFSLFLETEEIIM